MPADLMSQHIYSIYPEDGEYGIWDCVAKKGTNINYLMSKRKWIDNIIIYEWIQECVCGHNTSKNTKNLKPRVYLHARDKNATKDPIYKKKRP